MKLRVSLDSLRYGLLLVSGVCAFGGVCSSWDPPQNFIEQPISPLGAFFQVLRAWITHTLPFSPVTLIDTISIGLIVVLPLLAIIIVALNWYSAPDSLVRRVILSLWCGTLALAVLGVCEHLVRAHAFLASLSFADSHTVGFYLWLYGSLGILVASSFLLFRKNTVTGYNGPINSDSERKISTV